MLWWRDTVSSCPCCGVLRGSMPTSLSSSSSLSESCSLTVSVIVMLFVSSGQPSHGLRLIIPSVYPVSTCPDGLVAGTQPTDTQPSLPSEATSCQHYHHCPLSSGRHSTTSGPSIPIIDHYASSIRLWSCVDTARHGCRPTSTIYR